MAQFTDRQIITNLDEARFGSAGLATATSDPTSATQQIHQRVIALPYPVAEAAGTDFTYGALYTDRPLLICGVTIIPGVALTASATVYATVTLGFNDGNGGATTTIFAVTTNLSTNANGTGSWVLNTALAYTWMGTLAGTGQWLATVAHGENPFTMANVKVPANKLVQVAKTHASTGSVLGPFQVNLLVQEV